MKHLIVNPAIRRMEKLFMLYITLIIPASCEKQIVVPPIPPESPFLELENHEYSIHYQDTTLAIPLVTNYGCQVRIPEEVSSWVTAVTAKGPVNDTLILSVGYNEGYDRSAKVTVICTGAESSISDSLTIHQRHNDFWPIPITDAVFKKYLTTHFDSDGDGEISCLEAEAVTEIYFHDLGVKTLAGVEYFQNLTDLTCINELLLSSLDLTRNPKISEVWCNSNAITSLDIRGCTELTFLRCSGNRLISLDLSDVPSLKVLNCSVNPLSEIDLSALPQLNQLICDKTSLSSIDLSLNRDIRTISCTKCPNLTQISLPTGNMISITKDGSARIIWIDGSGQPISIPDGDEEVQFTDEVFEKVLLENFDYDMNGHITATEAELVQQIYCSNKGISAIDGLRHFPNLTTLDCEYNSIAALDVKNLSRLEKLVCSHNIIASLDLSECPQLNYLHCADNHLTELDIHNNTLLEFAAFYQNSISAIDLSGNKLLKKLYCYSCLLTELDFSVVPELELVWCDNNKLSAIDVSHNPKLQYLLCAANHISTLDVSNNPELFYLSCRQNPDLSTIWMKQGQNIEKMFMDEWVEIKYK